VSKSPLFFLEPIFGKSKKYRSESLIQYEHSHNLEEDFSSALYHQPLNIEKKSTVLI